MSRRSDGHRPRRDRPAILGRRQLHRRVRHVRRGERGSRFRALPASRGRDTDAEHFAVGGHQGSLGFGYGYDFGAARLHLGGRLQYLRLSVSGNYSLDYRDDEYRANYDYVAALLTASVASDWDSRVNLAAGLRRRRVPGLV
jgi:hypothetical protein